MCGIAGILSLNKGLNIQDNAIKRMTSSLYHRGPDDEGYFINKDIALGFRRLSIIDLDTGNQPIHNEDKRIWTVFNGEIYNYKELRLLLEKKGHVFYTKTDTEVIVHLYEEYGQNMVSYLRGMFGICIWDSNKKCMTLFRDRMGIKPLFYAKTDKLFIFASEIKAIMAAGLLEKEIDIYSLNHYLGLQ